MTGTPPRPPPRLGIADALAQADRVRRSRGKTLDALGWGPIETPHRIVFKAPGVQLRAYGDQRSSGPVWLIVPAPIKRPYIWDLIPRVSVVRRCLDAGGRVYLAAWTDAGPDEQEFGLAEYADRLLLACLDAIRKESGEARALLAGHSLGGTLAAIFAALHPRRAGGLVLLEAPLRFGLGSGAFAPLLALAPRAGALRTALGTVPGTLLNLVSASASPTIFRWSRWLDGLASLGDPQAFDTHVRVDRWTLDEFALPGRLFEEIVELLYRDDRFMAGNLAVGGRQARPENVEAPLLSVVDPRSRIVPPASVLPFHDVVKSGNKRLLCYLGDTGVALQHVGVLVGRNAHRSLWPEILRWAQEVWISES